MLQIFMPLFQLILLFLLPIYVVIIWGLTLPTLVRHFTQSPAATPGERTRRQAEIIRFIFSPITVLISFISYILAPVLALLGLIFFALAGVVIWPISLVIRNMPRFLIDLLAKIGALGEKILRLDTLLIANFDRRMRDLLRALLGTLGSAAVRFPPLISFAFRGLKRNIYVRERVLRDIRRFERVLRADIAADILIAIAQDPRHPEASRIEAVRLLREIGRPVGDLLHIIAVPGIDPTIAIEAANQAVQIDTKETELWQARAIQVWEELAAHPHPEARLRAAEQLSKLGKMKEALALLRSLVRNRNFPAEFRARAAGQLYETSVDAVEDETPAQVLSEAEQYLEQMVKNRNPRERLEGAAVLIELKRPEHTDQILSLLDDAELEPDLRRRALDLLVKLQLFKELRYAVEKPAPTPELEWAHRMEAIRIMEQVLPEEAVKYWATLAAQPGLPLENARQALASIRRLCSQETGGAQIATVEVQEAFTTLRELGSNSAIPAALRLQVADTLEALDQVKDANAIYYVLQNDPTVDKRLRRKATQAVSRLSRALLINRPSKQAGPLD